MILYRFISWELLAAHLFAALTFIEQPISKSILAVFMER